MEQWKNIIGYEEYYQISNIGNVRSKTRKVRNNEGERLILGQSIRPFINGSGYLQVNLNKEGERTRPFIHKLVAEHFIENPRNLSEVNHIDHDKTNCHVDNLEWCTREENMNAMFDFYNLRKKLYFCSCGNKVYEKGNKCVPCINLKNRVVERPTKEQLTLELQNTNFSEVGRKYGVSDNTIRKWCKYYEMSTKSKDYK